MNSRNYSASKERQWNGSWQGSERKWHWFVLTIFVLCPRYFVSKLCFIGSSTKQVRKFTVLFFRCLWRWVKCTSAAISEQLKRTILGGISNYRNGGLSWYSTDREKIWLYVVQPVELCIQKDWQTSVKRVILCTKKPNCRYMFRLIQPENGLMNCYYCLNKQLLCTTDIYWSLKKFLYIYIYIYIYFIHSLVFSLRGRVGRNQSPVIWSVWLWHTASWASSWG